MMHFQAQENNSSHSDFTVDNHTGIRYHQDMENTQIAYTEADKEAVRILRAAYMESTASDTLYNARQYLQDRARYERNMLHCECGQATTPEQLERANRFGIKADPHGHVHSFHGASA